MKVDIKLECLDNLTDLLKRFGREVEKEVREQLSFVLLLLLLPMPVPLLLLLCRE